MVHKEMESKVDLFRLVEIMDSWGLLKYSNETTCSTEGREFIEYVRHRLLRKNKFAL
jgi:hypothetical protein